MTPGLDPAERRETLKFDYDEALSVFRLLSDIRFKLLAFIPTVSGVAIALIGRGGLSTELQLGLGVIGFVLVTGLVFYDQRNSQLYNEAMGRAMFLEAELDLAVAPGDRTGGVFRSRGEPRRLLSLVQMRHDRALALVYGTVLATWLYLATQALTTLWLARTHEGRDWGIPSVWPGVAAVLVPVLVWVAIITELERLDHRHCDREARRSSMRLVTWALESLAAVSWTLQVMLLFLTGWLLPNLRLQPPIVWILFVSALGLAGAWAVVFWYVDKRQQHSICPTSPTRCYYQSTQVGAVEMDRRILTAGDLDAPESWSRGSRPPVPEGPLKTRGIEVVFNTLLRTAPTDVRWGAFRRFYAEKDGVMLAIAALQFTSPTMARSYATHWRLGSKPQPVQLPGAEMARQSGGDGLLVYSSGTVIELWLSHPWPHPGPAPVVNHLLQRQHAKYRKAERRSLIGGA